jgi:hypothetical protein
MSTKHESENVHHEINIQDLPLEIMDKLIKLAVPFKKKLPVKVRGDLY